jgi:hypothetical protein
MVGTPNAGSVQRGRMKHVPRMLAIAISTWACSAGCTASPTADGDESGTSGRTSGDGDAASDADPDADGDTASGGATSGDTTSEASTCEMCGGDACIDLESSAQHCGACDSPCPPGVACVAGECACPAGTEACDGACVDTMADGSHCGGCGRACEAGLLCNAGTCSGDCGALTECVGGCVDAQTHPLHCGGCDAPCTGGSVCTAGSCACPGEPVGYSDAIEPIFVAACTAMGCHGFPAPQEGLDLRAGEGFAALVGVPSTQCADGDP